MNIKTCWLCDENLTATSEHIIPQSLGGKRTVSGFICRDCNSRTGARWDTAVGEFESWKFTIDPTLLRKRQYDRPLRAQFTDSGLNAKILSGGQVIFGFNPPRETLNQMGELVYEFTGDARQPDELFVQVNSFLKRHHRQEITREEFNARAEYHSQNDPQVTFRLGLRMPKYFRSVTKTAMAMAFSIGLEPSVCENAVRYLRDETVAEDGAVIPFPGMTLEGHNDDWLDYHAVTIFSAASSGKLFGEIVYFGATVGLVILSNSYFGPMVLEGHSINLRTGRFEDADFNIPDLYLPESDSKNYILKKLYRFKSPAVCQLLKQPNWLN